MHSRKSPRPDSPSSWPRLAAALLVVLSSVAARAESSPAEAESAPANATAAEAPGARVFVDPETGELISEPSPEQVEALSRAIAEDTADAKVSLVPEEQLESFELSNGGVGVYVGGRFATSLVIHRHADGSWVATCADAVHLGALLGAPPAPAAEWEEK